MKTPVSEYMDWCEACGQEMTVHLVQAIDVQVDLAMQAG